jgi:putative heme-binding domain-containing protein
MRAQAEGVPPRGAAAGFRLPAGLTIEQVAAAPLIHYPLFACLDDRGRIYVAEGTGRNLPGTELVPLKLGKITRLVDADGDGRFDERTTFADGLVFPQGVLWHRGALYVASHPSLWKLVDLDDDGICDARQELVTRFGFNGNGCDIHGPFLGPDGWLYWTDGRHGHRIETREGSVLEGLAARIFRCRIDGTAVERVCGGGFDNPVELVFTETGEMLGTMDQGTGDCLLHYVEGGVYPRDDQPCLAEFLKTGPLLAPLQSFSAALPAALCGMARLRTDYLGEGFAGTLLTAQFNVHRVQQHRLAPVGATFRCTNADFLSSSNYDLRLTDVLEDADGTLLLVDMGAWFNYGCPTAKIARPEVTGSIYRVRRAGAKRTDDPWGLKLSLTRRDERQLCALLADQRPMVCDQALDLLAQRGKAALAPLQELLAAPQVRGDEGQARAKRNAIWALCRNGSAAAMELIRLALDDHDSTVRLAALHCVGLERDPLALPALERLVVAEDPAAQRRAAEALGRIGAARAVPALREALARGVVDRYLEHSLIYALVQIGDFEALQPLLADPHPRVRKAGLLVLDQLHGQRLARDQVAPLLDTDDPELQQTALEAISRRPGWSQEIAALIEEWITAEALDSRKQASLAGAIRALAEEVSTQQLVARRLLDQRTPQANRLLLVRAMARSRVERLPAAWKEALGEALEAGDAAIAREAVAAIRLRRLADYDDRLALLAARESAPADLRVAALECTAPRRAALDEAGFALLRSRLAQEDPLARVEAARTLGLHRPSPGQLLALCDVLRDAGPLEAPLLLPAFSATDDRRVGQALVESLRRSPGASALTPDELRAALRQFPEEVKRSAEPVLARLAQREHEQETYLAELVERTLGVPGNAERGRQVFFSAKVGCSSCHRMESQGGAIGPDLSFVGRYRDPRALLEAIVFPSSTIVPEYRGLNLITKEGQTITGLVVSQTEEALFVRTSQLAEVRLARGQIEEVAPANVSLMPQGLEKSMTDQEFADLLEFLFERR